VQGARQNFGGEALLDYFPGVHHRDLIGDLCHHRQAVGDQHDAHALLLLQPDQQVQHLRLDRHVQRGGGFIRDQQLRVVGDAQGDHRPLAHAAGEFMRKRPRPAGRIGDADALQECRYSVLRGACGQAAMGVDGFGDLVADAVHRVQAAQRVLEHHRHAIAAQAAQRWFVQARQILALEPDVAAGDTGGWWQQAHHGQAGQRLAGAAFADDGQSLPGRDG
jgi:hypothetical protein